MSRYASLEVIRKFCNAVPFGEIGDIMADDLTTDLILAIRKDTIAKDFTPAEIADLRPVATHPPGYESHRSSPGWNSIRELVTELSVFTRIGNDRDHWLASMDTGRNMDGVQFSDQMEYLADEIDAELEGMGGDALSMMVMRKIESHWRHMKNSSPRYYLCRGSEIDYIMEVTNEGSKKVVQEIC